ncbi:MAG: S24 family peptidase [Candidatus Woesearchaeota archaeon]
MEIRAIAERLEKVMNEKKITIEKLAEQFNINKNTIVNYKKGITEPKISFLTQFCEHYKINLHWLLTGEGEMFTKPLENTHTDKHNNINIDNINENYLITTPTGKILHYKSNNIVYIPVLDSYVSAGYGIENYDIENKEYFAIERRLLMPHNPEKCKILPVRGDSMVPTLYEGDWIVVAEGIIDSNGIYVLNRNGMILVKRLEFKLTGSIIVKSDNPNYTIEEISQDKIKDYFIIIGRVILVIHQLR